MSAVYSKCTVSPELTRVASYRNYPSSAPVRSVKLAAAGLTYTGYKDVVVCEICGFERGHWTANELPLAVHQQHNSHCKLLVSIVESKELDSAQLDFRLSCDDAGLATDDTVVIDYYETDVDLEKYCRTVGELKTHRQAAITRSVAAMREENLRTSARLKCLRCGDRPVGTLVLPCRHFALCELCAKGATVCVYCDTRITGTVPHTHLINSTHVI